MNTEAAGDPFAAVDAAVERGDVDGAWAGFHAILEAIDARGDAASSEDKLLRAEVYGRMAAIYDHSGVYPKARLAYLHQTEVLSEVVPDDDLDLLRARYNAAEIARVARDTATAVSEFDQVRPTLAAHAGSEARSLLALLDKNRGAALANLGRWAEAAESFRRALAATTQPERELELEVGIARAALEQGEPVDVNHLADRWAEVEARADPTRPPLALAVAVAGLLPADQRITIWERVVSAIPRDATGEDRTLRGMTLVNLTTGYLDRGDRSAALDAAMEAAAIDELVYADNVRSGGTLTRTIEPTWPVAPLLAHALRQPGPDRPDAVLHLHRAATGYKHGQAELLRAQYQAALGDPNLRSLVSDVRALRADATGAGDPFGVKQAAQAAAVPASTVARMFENSSAESITSVLSPGTALVEFVALREVSWDREEGSVPARYCAFVLTPDHAPVWLDLAPAQDVESAAAALIAAIPGAEGRRLRPVEAARGDWRAAAATLAELVWAPVADAIGEMREVLLAPDAALCAIPFDVLPDGPDDKPLLATRNVSLVATGRDLVRLDTRVNVRSREPLVVAAPEFGLPAAPFEPLPGTIVEGDAIAELLGVKALSGPAARRETVLEATNPEIIHLATHGYAGGLTDDHSLGPIADCGVALAGANTAGPLSRDGVLTGLDVLGMRLDGTDLVVLSACDTGIGQLDDYEGLQGLSRSFIVGGARGVVSSLWKVSDAATAELMTDYYRRLTAERPRAWALADAKRAFYVAQPDRPELWAAFVSIGDPEPLVRHRDIWVGEGQSPVYQVEFGSGPVVSGDQFTEWAEVRYAEADATPFYAGSHSFEGSYLGLVDDELYKGFESIGAGDAKAALRHAKRAKKRLKTGDMGRGRGRERHARTLRLHGLALAGTGDSKGARKKMRASVAAYEELDAWPDQLAAGLDNLGILEVNRGRVDQGIKLLERALAFKLAQLPVDADQVEFTRDVLAEIARHQDAPAE